MKVKQTIWDVSTVENISFGADCLHQKLFTTKKSAQKYMVSYCKKFKKNNEYLVYKIRKANQIFLADRAMPRFCVDCRVIERKVY